MTDERNSTYVGYGNSYKTASPGNRDVEGVYTMPTVRYLNLHIPERVVQKGVQERKYER